MGAGGSLAPSRPPDAWFGVHRGWWAGLAAAPVVWGLSRGLAARPEWVEQLYGERLSRWFAMAVGGVTRWAPFSVAEAAAVGLALTGMILAVRGWKGGRDAPRRLARSLIRIAALFSVGYAFFLLIWGIGALRRPLGETLGQPTAASTTDDLAALYMELVDVSNALRAQVPEQDGVATTLGDKPGVLTRAVGVFTRAGERWPLLAGTYAPPKPLILSPLMTRFGVLGIYMPLTGEPNIGMDPPAFVMPFSVCHEMAHQRGFTRENEANYVAWLVGRAAVDVDFRYSAAFSAQVYVAQALGAVDPGRWRELRLRVSPGVLADAAHWWNWIHRTRSRAADVTQAVNETYLRSQGSSGVRSYGEVVDLLLAERRVRVAAGR